VREDQTMRRFLLGGFGLALGVFARPAFAQDASSRPVRLGVPIADTAPALFEQPPIFAPAPTAAPVVGLPVNSVPMPMGMNPAPILLPAPRILGSGPNVTEVRTPTAAPPMAPTTSSTTPNLGAATSPLPTINPDDCLDGIGVPAAAIPVVPTGPIARNPRWWASGEYLLWW